MFVVQVCAKYNEYDIVKTYEGGKTRTLKAV